jgi:hypothetical protein
MARRTRRLLLFGLPAAGTVALAIWLLWPPHGHHRGEHGEENRRPSGRAADTH